MVGFAKHFSSLENRPAGAAATAICLYLKPFFLSRSSTSLPSVPPAPSACFTEAVSKQRLLHIAAYDVTDPQRLRRALDVVKNYASGGQKSVYECFLTDAERERLIADMLAVIDPDEDRFLLLRLDPRSKVVTLGIAQPPAEPTLYYMG